MTTKVAAAACKFKHGETGSDLAQEDDAGGSSSRRLPRSGALVFAVVGSVMPRRSKPPFTPQERDLIRLELMPRFGQEPDLANGLFLRTWRDGPQKGQPKIPKAIQSMLDRGLVKIGTNPMGRQAAFFTEAGLEALRLLLQDRRAMDLERFDHLRLKLGVGNPPASEG
jgi:hypothetical protein